MAAAAAPDFRSLIAAKSQELAQINEFRVSSLEALVGAKDAELADLRARLERIREDYAYNLSLFEARDAELAARLQEQFDELAAL